MGRATLSLAWYWILPVPSAAATHTRASSACSRASCCSSTRFHPPGSCGYTSPGFLALPHTTLGWEESGQVSRLGGCTLTLFPGFCCSSLGVGKSSGGACMGEPVPASLCLRCTPVGLPPSQALHALVVTWGLWWMECPCSRALCWSPRASSWRCPRPASGGAAQSPCSSSSSTRLSSRRTCRVTRVGQHHLGPYRDTHMGDMGTHTA